MRRRRRSPKQGLRRSLALTAFAALLTLPLHQPSALADLLDEEPAATPPPANGAGEADGKAGGTSDDETLDEAPIKPRAPSSSSPVGTTTPKRPPSSLPDDEPDAQRPNAGGKGGGSVLAPKGGGKKKSESNEPVHFESKGLRGLREKGTVELLENVVVEQGTMRMEAQRAKVFFDETTKDVTRVVADGDVKMFKIDEDSGEKIKAFGNQVVFDNRARTVVLEGNARLWRGADLVRGKKIVYEMDSGWIRADRVAGEVHPPEKDGKTAPSAKGEKDPTSGASGTDEADKTSAKAAKPSQAPGSKKP